MDHAFRAVGLDWHDHVVTDAAFIRPAEVDRLCADPSKARDELGWEPKIGFEELVAMMVDADMELLAGRRQRGRGVRDRILVVRRLCVAPSGARRSDRRRSRATLDSTADQAADAVRERGRDRGEG